MQVRRVAVQRMRAAVIQRVIVDGSRVRVRDAMSPAHGRIGIARNVNGAGCVVAWDEDHGARFALNQLEEEVVLGYHQTVQTVTVWDASRARTGHAMGSGDAAMRENELGDGVYVVPAQYIGDYDDLYQASNVYQVLGFAGVDYGIVQDLNGHQSVITAHFDTLRFQLHGRRAAVSSKVPQHSPSSQGPPPSPFSGKGPPPTDSSGKSHYSVF